MKIPRATTLLLLLMAGRTVAAQVADTPTLETFTSHGAQVGVRVFFPSRADDKPRSAIVLFHGGGWNEGEASWMDGIAAQYAGLGLVAISVDYRLSREGTTPFDAVADARNAIRWVRQEAARLGVDPGKVAALGTSAGAHLAASAAILGEPWGSEYSSVPNALVLRSPAISVASSLIGGVLLWVVTATMSGRMEAWDAPLYWKLAYPLGIVLAGVLGYWVPEKAWRWGLALMLVQGVMPVLGGAGLGLFPLALVMLTVLALPPMAAALLGSRIRRRTGAAP